MSASMSMSRMALMDWNSDADTDGKPASISGTRASSSALAIASFSSREKATPGICSPSLRVES